MDRLIMLIAVAAALPLTAPSNELLAQKSSVVSACSLLSAAEIKSITRRSDLAVRKPHVEESEFRSNCIYPGASSIGITVQTTSKQMYEKFRDMYKNAPPSYKLITYERAAGVGQDAYFLTHNDTQNVVAVVALVGGRELKVSLEKGNGHKPKVLALAKAAAAKLR